MPPRLSPMTPAQDRVARTYGRVVTGAYLVLGPMGLFVTGFDHFSNVDGIELFWFTVNPLTNLIHVLVGLIGIPMLTRPEWTRRFLLLTGVLGVPWAVTGYIVDGTLSDFFARNPALVTAHLVTGVLALAIALWPARGPAGAAAGEPRTADAA